MLSVITFEKKVFTKSVFSIFRYSGSKDSNRDHHDTTSQYSNPLFTSTADLQLRFLCPSDLDQVSYSILLMTKYSNFENILDCFYRLRICVKNGFLFNIQKPGIET